jgi:hypothetical protein
VTGLWKPVEECTPEQLRDFLLRWRDSPFDLQRASYRALTQLIQAAWYGNPAFVGVDRLPRSAGAGLMAVRDPIREGLAAGWKSLRRRDARRGPGPAMRRRDRRQRRGRAASPPRRSRRRASTS